MIVDRNHKSGIIGWNFIASVDLENFASPNGFHQAFDARPASNVATVIFVCAEIGVRLAEVIQVILQAVHHVACFFRFMVKPFDLVSHAVSHASESAFGWQFQTMESLVRFAHGLQFIGE